MRQKKLWLATVEVKRRVGWLVEADTKEEAREKADRQDIMDEDGLAETIDWRVISVRED